MPPGLTSQHPHARPHAFYGLDAWQEWKRSRPDDLKQWELPPATEWSTNPLVEVATFRELLRLVAFLNVMNKRYHLVFRGQTGDFEPRPTILRETCVGPTGTTIRPAENLTHFVRGLGDVTQHVARALLQEGLPRWRPFDRSRRNPRLRVAPWSIVQHYELWPTPLLDVTTSLRVAATFAFGVGQAAERASVQRNHGYLYVFGLRKLESDVMSLQKSATRFTAVRLSAVCPPEVERPHLQEGLLVGDPTFGDDVEPNPRPLSDRLVAKIRLIDRGDGPDRSFWDADYPRHSDASLLPNDEIRARLAHGLDYQQVDGLLHVDIVER